jgi:S-DNA-T family DNA segregation ATPase FtsK/SpoIIIE
MNHNKVGRDPFEEKDEFFNMAVDLILLTGQSSARYLQRRLKIGFGRASRIIDQMEMEGILGPFVGPKPRALLVDPSKYRKKT